MILHFQKPDANRKDTKEQTFYKLTLFQTEQQKCRAP